MFFARRSESPALAPGVVRGLRFSLNTPVVSTQDLPSAPARAAILIHGPDGTDASPLIGVRSLKSGQVVYFEPEGDLDGDGLDAAMAFGEGMGFLFDDDELDQGDTQRAFGMWTDLMVEPSAPAANEALVFPTDEPDPAEVLLTEEVCIDPVGGDDAEVPLPAIDPAPTERPAEPPLLGSRDDTSNEPELVLPSDGEADLPELVLPQDHSEPEGRGNRPAVPPETRLDPATRVLPALQAAPAETAGSRSVSLPPAVPLELPPEEDAQPGSHGPSMQDLQPDITQPPVPPDTQQLTSMIEDALLTAAPQPDATRLPPAERAGVSEDSEGVPLSKFRMESPEHEVTASPEPDDAPASDPGPQAVEASVSDASPGQTRRDRRRAALGRLRLVKKRRPLADDDPRRQFLARILSAF